MSSFIDNAFDGFSYLLGIFALIDVLRRPATQFLRVDQGTKPMWIFSLVMALLGHVALNTQGRGLLTFLMAVPPIFYLFVLRPRFGQAGDK